MKVISRRQFLYHSTLVLSSTLLPISRSGETINGKKGMLITGDDTDKNNLTVDFVDLDRNARTKVPISFLVHSFDFDPLQPRLLCTEKNGERLGLIDLKSKKVMKTIKSPPNRLFNGHSVYTKNGDRILATLKVSKNDKKLREGEGFIGIFSPDELNYLGEFPSHGFYPHDCCIMDDGKTLLVLNTNVDFTDPQSYRNMDQPANYSFINVDKGILERKVNSLNSFSGSGHLDFKGSIKDLVMVGAEMNPSGKVSESSIAARMYGFSSSYEIRQINVNPQVNGFFLTVAVDKNFKISGATAPVDNSVVFYDYQNGKLLKKFNIKKPMGITVTQDERYFVITSYEGIRLISIPDLVIQKTAYPFWEMEQSHPVTFRET